MCVKIIFASLLGLAVILPLAACSDPQTDFEKGLVADEIQDYHEATRWYRKAAEQDFALAQAHLGDMYKVGRGVARDDREAVRWYRKAADQGNAKGQYSLGTMYETGRGVAQNDRQAVRWYRKSAEQGFHHAQFSLGALYARGKRIAQDYVQAHKWFNIASVSGDPTAAMDRQQMEEEMSAQQIAEAKREATKWLEAYEKRKGE